MYDSRFIPNVFSMITMDSGLSGEALCTFLQVGGAAVCLDFVRQKLVVSWWHGWHRISLLRLGLWWVAELIQWNERSCANVHNFQLLKQPLCWARVEWLDSSNRHRCKELPAEVGRREMHQNTKEYSAEHFNGKEIAVQVDFRVMLTFLEFYRAMVKLHSWCSGQLAIQRDCMRLSCDGCQSSQGSWTSVCILTWVSPIRRGPCLQKNRQLNDLIWIMHALSTVTSF